MHQLRYTLELLSSVLLLLSWAKNSLKFGNEPPVTEEKFLIPAVSLCMVHPSLSLLSFSHDLMLVLALFLILQSPHFFFLSLKHKPRMIGLTRKENTLHLALSSPSSSSSSFIFLLLSSSLFSSSSLWFSFFFGCPPFLSVSGFHPKSSHMSD